MMTEPAYLNFIHHSRLSRYVTPNTPYPGEQVHIQIQARLDAPVQQVLLRTCPDGEQVFIPMQLDNQMQTANCRWWGATIHISMPLTSYRFLIISKDGDFWYNGSGNHNFNPTDAEDFRILADYQAPDWLRKSVFYQIFPDRFADGDPTNSVCDGEYEYSDFTRAA